MNRSSLSWIACALCAWAVGSTAVRAQGAEATEAAASPAPESKAADGTDVERARALFSEGLAFVEANDWVHAEERFRSVLAIKESLVVSYNLASALVHLDRLIEGSELLRAMLRDRTLDAKTYAATRQLLSEVEPRIASLTLRFSGDASGVTVRIDERPIELKGQVLMTSVDPGEHTLLVKNNGAVVRTEVFSVGGASPLKIDLTIDLPSKLAPQAVASAGARDAARGASGNAHAASNSKSADSGASPPKWWLWAGAGALAVTAAVVVIAVASSGGQAAPVSGDTDPPVVRGIVVAMP